MKAKKTKKDRTKAQNKNVNFARESIVYALEEDGWKIIHFNHHEAEED